jgi:hypothetical protein
MPGISVQGAYLTRHGAKSFSQHLPEHKALCQRESSRIYMQGRHASCNCMVCWDIGTDQQCRNLGLIRVESLGTNTPILYTCVLQICKSATKRSVRLSVCHMKYLGLFKNRTQSRTKMVCSTKRKHVQSTLHMYFCMYVSDRQEDCAQRTGKLVRGGGAGGRLHVNVNVKGRQIQYGRFRSRLHHACTRIVGCDVNMFVHLRYCMVSAGDRCHYCYCTTGVGITGGYFVNNRIEPLLRSLGLELIRIG